MGRYIIRLDDASEKRDIEKWDRMEELLDRFDVKPLVGVIPHCEDLAMEQYSIDENFWGRCNEWVRKGWHIAMHGYNHVYISAAGGMNPVNLRSEFAGVSPDIQRDKIRKGIEIMRSHGVEPQVFFAPSHTFDENTLRALRAESNVRFISDTIATKPYFRDGFTFVPQQSGRVRRLPFEITTFCYHPNMMSDKAFRELEDFLRNNKGDIVEFPLHMATNSFSGIDRFLTTLYFAKRKFKEILYKLVKNR